MKMRHLTWGEFDTAVETIACELKGRIGSVYGPPRGGLPLAVALSHRLNVPLVDSPHPDSLIVDDVVETGLTFGRFAGHDPALMWAWVNKSGRAVNAVIHDRDIGWLVFPWEDRGAAERDAHDYQDRRQRGL